MRAEVRRFDTPWVLPEVCPAAAGAPQPAGDLSSAIERAEGALAVGSIGRLVHALVAVRAALRTRAMQRDALGVAEQWSHVVGPWKRRLRRRYAASMCAVERLLETAWGSCDFEAVRLEAGAELERLRRLESLENEAHLDQHWTDLGVGD